MKKFWSPRPEERGAVLVMAVVGVVVTLVAAALAIDIGRLAHDKRSDQKVADLAAIDAVRAATALSPTPDALTRARDSATRNGFSYDTSGWGMSGMDLNVCRGIWTTLGPLGGTFAPNNPLNCGAPPLAPVVSPITEAVRVHVESPFKALFPFVGGSDGTSATGIATQAGVVVETPPTTTVPPTSVPPPVGTPTAGFTLGSSLATMDTSRSSLLNAVVGGMLDGNVNLAVASWQGLIDGHVTLLELQDALVTNGAITLGTPSQLLAEQLTVGELFQATLDALEASNRVTSAQATALNGLITAAANVEATATVQLSDLITVASGSEAAALSSELNVFQLVNASAAVSNGEHFIDVSVPNITVPGVLSTNLHLQVIEAPMAYYGPEGGPTPALETAQISLTVTPTISVNVPGVATITGTIPIKAEGGKATGQLALINCGDDKMIQVDVTTEAASGSASSTLNARIGGIIPINLPLPIGVTTSAGGGDYPGLGFTYPDGFGPPGGHVGGTTLNPDLTLNVLGINVAAVLAALNPILDDVDNLIINPLLAALGLDLGAADVTALGPLQGCTEPPVPTSSTTSTVPSPTTTTPTIAPQPKLVQ